MRLWVVLGSRYCLYQEPELPRRPTEYSQVARTCILIIICKSDIMHMYIVTALPLV